MDYICRKIQLQAGDKVVDAGCGWGALALHMAKHYGASVKAFNISKEQILFARDRAKEEGLSRQVEFIEDDYRSILGQFDAFVSVGMLEHVGAEHYKDLGRVVHRTIGATGRGLLHFIGRNQARSFSPWIRKRIFPGAYVPALRQVMDLLEPWDFSVLDLENLRYHYVRTLEHWLARFESSTGRVSQMFGPEFVRAWRLYLAGSIAAFRVGNLQLFQLDIPPASTSNVSMVLARTFTNSSQRQRKNPDGFMRYLDCRRRACGFFLCVGVTARGPRDVAILDKRVFPRDKICGGWITPAVLNELRIDPLEYARDDHVLQSITGFRTSWMGGPEVQTDYGRTVSYGIRRFEFDEFLLQRCGARVFQGESLTRLERLRA